MSEMTTNESWERLDHGLQRAASCCRELCKMTGINSWVDLSRELLLMRKKAKVMYDGPALTEVEVNALVTQMEIAQLASQQIMGP